MRETCALCHEPLSGLEYEPLACLSNKSRHADKELLQNDVSSGSDDENLKENGGVNSTSTTVNFVLSDSSSSGRLRSFSLAAPKLQASASFTIESRASRSASIAESGFGMSAAKRFAFSVSQPKNAEAEGESCAPSRSSEVATTVSSESTSNSVSGSSRGLTPSRTVIQHVPGMAMQSESSSFVFGCDMSDRVTNTPTQAANEEVTSDEVRKEEGSLNNHSSVNESGSPGGLFAQASSRLSDGAVVASVTPPPVFKVPEIVDVKTGEENDKNILQVHCVLHVFDSKTHGWSERGCGLLWLNDMHHPNEDGTFQSRLVMRTDGSLRLTLNTLLWPQMVCEKASRQSIRITALDAAGQGIRVFLITYPKSEDEFSKSGLTGEWDMTRAGKRMKLVTPYTWEAVLSRDGNMAESWGKAH
ncbi:ran-binding protein 3-like [Corticium candelabrum]|uniref:ran-binding protein 3-like n=1 Tax=Corticium candelabrum TaxID=121492 RepID=UPI002E258E05|nr:ran-binding protein 3-like [Corticium candelabrum]